MSGSLSGRRVAVTGAGGFIGARLVEQLARVHGADVTAVVRSAHNTRRAVEVGAAVVHADLGRRRQIEESLVGQEIVFNTAHDFRASSRANLRAFSNLADACAYAGTRRLVHVSSVVVYDAWPGGEVAESGARTPDGSAYRDTKIAIERSIETRAARGGPTTAIVQPTIVYGPRGWMWTERLLEQLRSGTVVLPDPCDGNCHAVHVDDVVDALVRAATADLGDAERFVVSGPGPVSWRDFFEAYARLVAPDALRFEDLRPETDDDAAPATGWRAIAADPMRLAQWGPVRTGLGLARRAVGEAALERLRARLMAYRGRSGPIETRPTPEEIALYQARGTCSIARAEARLGYAPAWDLDRGMADVAAWLADRAGTPGDRRA